MEKHPHKTTGVNFLITGAPYDCNQTYYLVEYSVMKNVFKQARLKDVLKPLAWINLVLQRTLPLVTDSSTADSHVSLFSCAMTDGVTYCMRMYLQSLYWQSYMYVG